LLIGNQLSFQYQDKINTYLNEIIPENITTRSYISNIGFDNISNSYIDIFNKNIKDLSMNSITQLNDYIKSSKYNEYNTVFIQNNNFYQNKLELDFSSLADKSKKRANLINNIIQLNIIRNIDIPIDDPLYSTYRIFRKLLDNDTSLLNDILLNNPDSSKEEIINILRDKLIDEYGECSIIDFKLDLIVNNKGKGEYDIMSDKYKKQIIKTIEDNIRDISTEELEKLIYKYNNEFYKNNILIKSEYSQLEIIELKERNINDLKDIDLSILKPDNNLDEEELLDDLDNYNNILIENFSEYKDIKLSDYYNIISEIYRNKILPYENSNSDDNSYIDMISDIKSYFDKTKIEEKLKRFFAILIDEDIEWPDTFGIKPNLDSYYKELDNNIDIEIIREKIKSEDMEMEKKFRKNKNFIDKDNTLLRLYISSLNTMINYLHIVINKINNNGTNDTSQFEFKNKGKYPVIIKKIDNKFSQEIFDSQSKVTELCNDLIREIKPKGTDINYGCTASVGNDLIKNSITSNRYLQSTIELLEKKINEIKKFKELLNNIISINFKLNNNSNIDFVNILSPFICRKLLSFFVIKIFVILTTLNQKQIIELILNNLLNLYQTFSIEDIQISNTIKDMRAKANQRRKNNFNRLSDELKFTQKLYRRYNLGNLFGMEEESAITAEEEFQGVNVGNVANIVHPDTGDDEEHDALLLQNDPEGMQNGNEEQYEDN